MQNLTITTTTKNYCVGIERQASDIKIIMAEKLETISFESQEDMAISTRCKMLLAGPS